MGGNPFMAVVEKFRQKEQLKIVVALRGSQ